MSNPLLTDAIDKIASGGNLSSDEAADVMRELMEGRASEVQAAAFLIALRTKGETVDELTGFARTMRELSRHVEVEGDDLLDTCGTGGGPQTFNVSTTAAIVAAGAGCRVAKHGGRSNTRQSGSADLLEALGAYLDLELEPVAEALAALGCRSGLVVSSADGLDEISVSAETRVMEVGEDEVKGFSVSPEGLGVEPVPFESLS